MSATHYDAVIIGAGQAGVPLATTLANAGHRTALVEREHIGGTCVNEGCYPSKTMIASGRVAYLARRAADYGVHTGPVTVNLAEVRQRKRAIVKRLRSATEQLLAATAGLDLMFGQAHFNGRKTLAVRLNSGASRIITADLIFINTGARPATPAMDGIDDVRTLNSTTIMELERVPEHLLILGGGYVGLEFGQLFRRFASHVTIVHRGPQLLSREDDDVAGAVAGILREDGVEVLLDSAAILGIEGGEILAVLQMAMLGQLPYTVLREAVFAHPTLAESLNNLFTAMDE